MGAMSSSTKPWEMDLADNPEDPRLPQNEAKETDGLLAAEKGLDKPDNSSSSSSSKIDHCDYTLGLKPFVSNLNDHFGYKLLWLLVAAQFLLKGFARDFAMKADPYMYKLYHVPASRMQVYQGITSLPWAMKPIIGLVSDMFPIGGYNKAPYMLVTSVLALVGFVLVGTSSPSVIPVIAIVVCFILIQLQSSTGDLLSEAKYAEKMQDVPAHGPSLMTFVWFGMQVGSLMAVLLSGVIIGRFGAQTIYLIALFPAAVILVPVYFNYMEETKQSSEQAVQKRAKFMAQRETVWLCGLMLIGTLTLITIALTAGHNVGPAPQGIAAGVVGAVMLLGFSVLLSPTIAKFNAFSIIQTSMTLSVSGAAFYFYTDTPEQYPDGPHFSPFFYNSVVGLVTSVCSLFGIWCYQRYMTTWKYRNILLVTNVLYSVLCLPDIVLFTRANLAIGIPDHVFMIGSSVLQNIVFQWQWMPQVVILSFLCPKGMEATMYALLAGSHNLGNTIASSWGACMLHALSINPTGAEGEGAQFDNLWKASAISSVLPLVTIFALFWLIPDARQNETIMDAARESATSGSLWRRWTDRDRDHDA